MQKSVGARKANESHEPSLYEKLQENKAAAQTEFYEESKSGTKQEQSKSEY